MPALLLALALACLHAPALEAAARAAHVPSAIVQAVARVESNCDPRAVSVTGAVGLMQILPSWGRSNLSVRCDPLSRALGAPPDLFDPAVNACFGARILRYEFARSRGRWPPALERYSGRSYPSYVPRVRRILLRLAAARSHDARLVDGGDPRPAGLRGPRPVAGDALPLAALPTLRSVPD